MKLFDFGGMDKRHLPFREIEPEEGNVVVSISYSGTGHAFLVCTAGSQPKVGDVVSELASRGWAFFWPLWVSACLASCTIIYDSASDHVLQVSVGCQGGREISATSAVLLLSINHVCR